MAALDRGPISEPRTLDLGAGESGLLRRGQVGSGTRPHGQLTECSRSGTPATPGPDRGKENKTEFCSVLQGAGLPPLCPVRGTRTRATRPWEGGVGASTCLACFQDSSHCLMVPLASSSSCRSRASSAAPGPDRKAGEVPGEKLPEAKCSQMLLFMPFRPAQEGEEHQRPGGPCPAQPGLPGAARREQGQAAECGRDMWGHLPLLP